MKKSSKQPELTKKVTKKKAAPDILNQMILIDRKNPEPIDFESLDAETRAYLQIMQKHVDEGHESQVDRNAMMQILLAQELRMIELLKRYNILENEPSKWYTLALKLATEKYKGFKFRNKNSVGRKIEWDDSLNMALWLSVKYFEAQGSQLEYIFRDLLSHEPWKNFFISRNGAELGDAERNKAEKLLQKRYYLFKDSDFGMEIINFKFPNGYQPILKTLGDTHKLIDFLSLAPSCLEKLKK